MGVLSGSGEAVQVKERSRLIADLAWFFATAFGITWLICGVYIVGGERATELFGPMKLGEPAFYAAVYGPFMAALLVTAAREGADGLRAYFRRLTRIKAPPLWIAISLLGYPVLWLIVALVQAFIAGDPGRVEFNLWYAALPAVLLAGHIFTDPGALGEEPGWRGYALPRLLELMTARNAALFLGLIWGIWHLPAFYLAGLSQSKLNFGLFLVSVLALSMLMTWLFVHTNGSVIWGGIIPHMMFNATPKSGIETNGVITIALAALILVLFGRHMKLGGRRGSEATGDQAISKAPV